MPAPAVKPPDEVVMIRVIRFFSKFKAPIDGVTVDHEGNPVTMVEEHWVEWVKIGDAAASTCVEAVKRIAPRDDRPARVEWNVVGPAYTAWLRKEEAPVNGQPLYAWSGCSRELADELRKNNINSVEEVANYPDHRINSLPIPGFRELRQRAKATIEARSSNEVGDKLAARDAKIEQMQTLLANAQVQIENLTRQIAAIGTPAVAAAVVAAGPHPDDEFVEPGPGDRRVSDANGFVRRQPTDHISAIFGEDGNGDSFEPLDGDATD